MQSRKLAVIGAGIAGLACARALQEKNAHVTVFDKGTIVGGRTSVRSQNGFTFDMGAQFFTVLDPRFSQVAEAASNAGICAPWRGKIVAYDGYGNLRPDSPTQRWVGTPNMNALAQHLAAGVTVATQHRVDVIERVAQRYVLHGTRSLAGIMLKPHDPTAARFENFGTYDGIALCLPAPQASRLLETVHARLAAVTATVAFDPCFAVGFASQYRLETPSFDAAFIGSAGAASASHFSWVARNSSKPQRDAQETWVLHASAAWSERPPDDAANALITAFKEEFSVNNLSVAATVSKQWRYARAATPVDAQYLHDTDAHLALGGDWAAGGRIEGAYLSGLTAASQLL